MSCLGRLGDGNLSYVKEGSKCLFFCGLIASIALPGFGANASETYVVDAQGPTLFEVSILLYGKPDSWREIARLNGITEPRNVRAGQVLSLPDRKRLDPAEGKLALLNYWRAHFGLHEVAAVVAPVAPLQIAPVIGPVAAPIRVDSAKAEILLQPAPAVPEVWIEPVASMPVPIDASARENLLVEARTPEEKSALGAAELLESGKTVSALDAFRRQRLKNPEIVPTWFFELKCLKELGREQELQEILAQFVERFPQMGGLPVVQKYRDSHASSQGKDRL